MNEPSSTPPARPILSRPLFTVHCLLFTSLLLAGTARADTTKWIGGTSAEWGNSANWDNGLPGPTKDVVIDRSYTPTYSPTLNVNGTVTIASLVISGDTSVVTLTLTNSNISTSRLRVTGNVTIAINGNLTHGAETATGTGAAAQTEKNQLFLDVGGDLTIAAGGQISVSACGYGGTAGNSSGYGPGGSLGDGQSASHGGENGVQSSGQSSAPTYGSVTNPVRSGSGTGYNLRGGGAVKLTIGGALNLNGSILADGTGSWMNGSGGSINIVAGTLAGNGTVSANGGTAGPGQMSGGGGGRVAIVLTNADDTAFSALSSIRAYGGLGVTTDYRCGAAGTVYLKATNTVYGRLIVDNNNISSTTTKRTLINSAVGDLTVGDVVLRNQGRLSFDAGRKATVYGSWSNGVAADAFGTPPVTLAGSAPATVWGANNWYSLAITNAGKTVTFQSGVTQTINAGGALTLAGDSINALTLNATSPGTKWNLKATPSSVVAVNYVNATDSDASTGDPIKAPNSTLTTCINWFTGPDAVTWNSGAATRNWGTAGNWDKAHVPLDWDDVTIVSAGNSPTLDVSRVVGTLTVASGGNLGLNGQNLTVSGNMTVTGTVVAAGSEILTVGSNLTFATGGVFTPAQSTVRLGGAGPQSLTLGGRTFYGLNIANTNAVTVTDTFTTRDLTFTNSSINVSFQDSFTATNVQAFVSGASTLTFGSGKTYAIDTLTLVGAAANKLVLTNSSASAWLLHVTGFGGAGNVAVSGSDASGYATICAANSDDDGGNQNWDFGSTNKVWVGTTTNWVTASNWAPGGEPGSTNVVLILSGAAAQPTVPVSGGKTIQSLMIAGASTLTFDGGDVSSKKLRVNGNAYIGANATLTHTAETKTSAPWTETHRLFLDVGGDLTIAANGAINVSSRGYSFYSGGNPYNGYGPGGPAAYGSGAGHGGQGGNSATAGTTYDSVINPTNSGSGAVPNRGGGAVKLTVGGGLTVNGTISADGGGGGGLNADGASGGSVNITAGTLAGTGTISANGGGGTTDANRGAGGGGRVALVLTNDYGTVFDAWLSSARITAYGGSHTTATKAGGAGTVYLKGTNNVYGRLIVDNNNVSSTTTSRTLINSTVGDITVGDVILQNQGRLSYDATSRKVTAYGSWSNGVANADSAAATVTLAGGSPATVWGDNNWYSLTITNAGKTVKFQAGKTQTINASGTVLFDNNVTLQSTTDGGLPADRWILTKGSVGATQNVGRVSARDSNASAGNAFHTSGGSDLGNNLNWKFPPSGTLLMVR